MREAALSRGYLALFDHAFGDIGSGDMTAGADGVGGAKCDEPGSTREIEHAFARGQRCHAHETVLRRLELFVPALLVRRRGAIPSVALHALLQLCVHTVSARGRVFRMRSHGT